MPSLLSPWALLVPVLLAPIAAQDVAPFATGLRSACGLQAHDGELWGIGPDYKVNFRAGGVEYTPALGRRAPRNVPLTLRLAATGRDSALTAVAAAAPTAHDLQVRYRRAGVVERYDVTAHGIAQSFVFDTLPRGNGDLVVQLDLTTDLPLVAANTDGLRFELADIGGVAIGAVTGIDANGQQAPGTITCDGRTVELRLPARFVRNAAFPLVLDPQIGTVFAVTNSAADYQDPELVAPCVGGGNYLCVFEREISSTDRDIRGIRLNEVGSAVGSLFSITTGTGDDRNPTAGSIAQRSSWIVAYVRGGDVFVRSVNSSGVVGTEYTAVSGTDNQIEPDLGSEITTIDDDAVLVFRNSTLDAIQATNVTLFSSGLIATAAPLTIGSGFSVFTVGRPRISHDGGDVGRYLVVYPRTQGLGDTKPQLVLLDRDVNVLATAAATSTTNDEDSPDVDGNGRSWTVVFESEANEGTGDNDILALSVHFDEGAGTLHKGSPVPVTALANVDEIDPAIAAFRSGSCLLGWRRRAAPGSSNTEVFLKTIDPMSCAECEPTVLLANTSDIETNLTAAASPFSENQGLVLWETSTASGGNGDIDGVAWLAADGAVVTPFGQSGCGPVVFPTGGCARVGKLFPLRVYGVNPASGGTSISTFMLSLGTSTVQCGACRLYADPFAGFALGPDAGGASVIAANLPIPDAPTLRGMTFHVQWLVHKAAGACSWLQADFTPPLSITLE